MNKKDLQAFKVVTCCHNRQKTWLYKVLIQHMGVSIAYVIVPSTPVTQTADSGGLIWVWSGSLVFVAQATLGC